MRDLPLAQLIPVLQVAIGPMILVSGVGMLLLMMTGRLARVVDRSRVVRRELKVAEGAEAQSLALQFDLLARRSRLVQRAIFLAALSVLFAAILVIALFVAVLADLDASWAVAGLFVLCLSALVASLGFFLGDVNYSLRALRIEMRGGKLDR